SAASRRTSCARFRIAAWKSPFFFGNADFTLPRIARRRHGIGDEARIAVLRALEEVMGTDLRSGLRFAPPRVEIERRSDGAMILRSPLALRGHRSEERRFGADRTT